jgi:hypothetical protein
LTESKVKVLLILDVHNLGRMKNNGTIKGYFQNLTTSLARDFTLLYTTDEARKVLLEIMNKMFLVT